MSRDAEPSAGIGAATIGLSRRLSASLGRLSRPTPGRPERGVAADCCGCIAKPMDARRFAKPPAAPTDSEGIYADGTAQTCAGR